MANIDKPIHFLSKLLSSLKLHPVPTVCAKAVCCFFFFFFLMVEYRTCDIPVHDGIWVVCSSLSNREMQLNISHEIKIEWERKKRKSIWFDSVARYFHRLNALALSLHVHPSHGLHSVAESVGGVCCTSSSSPSSSFYVRFIHYTTTDLT